MADLHNVEAELAFRIRGAQTELGHMGIVAVVTSGYRSRSEQQYLYDRYKAGKGPLAAPPGQSDHEDDPSTAVDLALSNPTRSNKKKHGEVAARWGLQRTIASEYWHLQLHPKREAPPVGAPTKEEAMTLVIEPAGAAPRPQDDGGWAWGRRGHVYHFGLARYYGGWDDKTRNGNRRCVALVPTLSGNGYWLVSDLGEVFAYGDAKYPGNYRSEWGAGAIIGAYRNARQTNGGVTLVRDDGENLNRYALPA
jgi:hypothetical protein